MSFSVSTCHEKVQDAREESIIIVALLPFRDLAKGTKYIFLASFTSVIRKLASDLISDQDQQCSTLVLVESPMWVGQEDQDERGPSGLSSPGHFSFPLFSTRYKSSATTTYYFCTILIKQIKDETSVAISNTNTTNIYLEFIIN